jgi:hypothetical protein
MALGIIFPEMKRRHEIAGCTGDAALMMNGLMCHESDLFECLCLDTGVRIELQGVQEVLSIDTCFNRPSAPLPAISSIECPVSNYISQIELVRTGSNSVITVSCLFAFMCQNWKNISQPSEILRIFLKGGTGKVTMDVEQKKQAVIEFLRLERREGDVTTLCSGFKMRTIEMYTVELLCSDG